MNNNYSNTYESIKCPVCLQSFDANQHIPKIFPTCGHTICKECLIQVLHMDSPKCPLDKSQFDKIFRTIEPFPTNFLGKELLEMEGSWNRCPIHHEQNKMICLTDNSIICYPCFIFGEHKGHDIRLLFDYEETIATKKNQLSIISISDKISNASSQLLSHLEENKQKMKTAIQERFENLRIAIMSQEIQVLLKFENVFVEDSILKL